MIRWLRRLRILLAAVVLLVATLAFGLGESWGERFAPIFASSQAVPSLLRLVATGSALAGLSLLAILLGTLLAGRWYCSVLCPLGLLQDAVRRLGRFFVPLRKRQDRSGKHASIRHALRISLLVAVAISATAGSLALLNLLDPYSIFGRTAAGLLRPLALLIQHGLASLLEQADIFALSGAPPVTIVWGTVAGIVLFLALPVFLGLFRGRLYCNSVCPVGAILSALARFSPLRIRTKDGACVGCGKCVKKCRADCISLTQGDRKARVDASECVLCLDCIACCPTHALEYNTGPRLVLAQVDGGRRELLALGATCAAALVAVPLRSLASVGFVPEQSLPIIPPGGLNLDHFTSACTGCHLCVASCPGHVLQPRLAAHGGRGLYQPTLDYLQGFCDYECNVCSNVCPNGALIPLDLATKQRVQIGMVNLLEDRCVVYARKEDCGACIEVCPTHAVYGEDRDGVLYPVTDGELCIGCGACENACPQNPRAIVVDALAEHGTALDPSVRDHSADSVPAADPNLGNEGFPF